MPDTSNIGCYNFLKVSAIETFYRTQDFGMFGCWTETSTNNVDNIIYLYSFNNSPDGNNNKIQQNKSRIDQQTKHNF